MTTRKIWSRAAIGSTARVVQAQTLLTRNLSLDETALIMVHQGSKRLSREGQDILLTAGEAILVSAGIHYDVTNIPSPHTSLYEAHWLSFPGLTISNDADGLPRVLRQVSSRFKSAFNHTAEAIVDTDGVPERVARKRMEEMVLWLEEYAIALSPVVEKRLSQKARLLFAGDMVREWSAAEVAQHFAMSEATLRRKLKAENASFQQLLTEVRMCHALTLLQVTDLPVSQVAYDVGYESPSKFTARFRTRFGFNPGQIRARSAAAHLLAAG